MQPICFASCLLGSKTSKYRGEGTAIAIKLRVKYPFIGTKLKAKSKKLPLRHSRESESAQKVHKICLNRHSERSEESIYCRSIEILRYAQND